MGWKSKFIFLLIVYFAGFATAIYCLTPVPDKQTAISDTQSSSASVLKSDEFVKSFNLQMHRCTEWGRDATVYAGRYMKQIFLKNGTAKTRSI